MQNIFSRITKYSIYVLVFLMPLFWLPFTFEVFEFNKQYLLFFLVSLGLLAWLVKMVVYDREVRFKISPLDPFVLGFLAIAVISTVFSADQNSSLYGFYGRFNNGLIGLLSLGALYFLITNHTSIGDRGREADHSLKISKIFNLFLCSIFLVLTMGYFSVFGVWNKLAGILPPTMLQNTFNPVAGSLEGLAVFLAAAVVLIIGLFLMGSGDENKLKSVWFKGLLLAGSLGLMVIIDYTMAWLVLLIPLVLVVGLSIWKRLFKENVNRLLLPILLIIISAGLVFYSPSLMNLSKEQVLSQGISWQVGLKSAIGGFKNGFLGSGPGTFYFDFAEHKPASINQSWFWQIRFDRAGSHLAELLGTIGFLGLIAYLAIIGIFLLVSWFLIDVVRAALKENKGLSGTGAYMLPLFMTFLALFAGQFVYYQNNVLAFTFWLILGLAAVAWHKPITEKTLSFKNFPELSLVFSTLVIVLSVGLLAVYFYASRFYLADMNYVKALSSSTEQRIAFMEQTVRLNPQLAYYRIVLARIYLGSVLTEIVKPEAQRDLQKVQVVTAQAIDQAKAATILQPNSAATWETMGMIYREITGFTAGAIDWGIKSFERAIGVEPTNPVFYTEVGKLYVLNNQQDKAKESFQKALEKKSDYADALIEQALILEKENILDEAITTLEKLVTADQFHVEGLFQLGRLYFNRGRAGEAIILFQRATALAPGYSNAHYALGVAYAAQGEKDLAIKEFERVLELNPGNQDVLQKLKQMKE